MRLEIFVREDLQNPAGDINPPFLIRNGFAGNAWVPLAGGLPQHQTTPFEILPFAEMPQVVNPPSGFIVNANNDQVGNTHDNNPLNDLREGGGELVVQVLFEHEPLAGVVVAALPESAPRSGRRTAVTDEILPP